MADFRVHGWKIANIFFSIFFLKSTPKDQQLSLSYIVSMFSLLNGPNLRRRIFGTFLHLAIMGNVLSGLDNDLGMMEEYLT